MEDIKKEGWVAALLALFLAVINRINQNAEINRIFIFTKPEMHWKYYVVTIAALLASFLFFLVIVWMVFELGKWHHKRSMEFIRYFLVYFSIQLVILFCIWPGNLKQDEVYLIGYAVVNMGVYWFQSFISQIFYMIALMIFPYVVSVTFFQIFMISLLAAGVMQKTAGLLEHKKLTWWLMLPFLLLPVLDSNQFPLRNSMICWIYLYIIICIYREYKKTGAIGKKCACISVFLAVFIGVWKMEFLYLVPVLIVFITVIQKSDRWKLCLRVTAVAAVGYFILTMPNRLFQAEDDNYLLTAVVAPLSEIMVNHQHDYAEDLQDEFQLWDSFMPVENLIDDPGLGKNVPLVFHEAPILNRRQEWQYLRAALNIFLQYPGEFAKERFLVYRQTNGMVPNVRNHGNAEQPLFDGKDLYNAHFRYTQLGNAKIRSMVIAFLACRENGNYLHTTFLYPILYNSTWGILLMLIFGMIFLIRKRIFHAVICGTILCQLVPIYLTAPAPFFMYYMPFYLTSCVMSVVFVLEWLDKKNMIHEKAVEKTDE